MSQRERIVRYLLGQQTEEEREQTELDYFADAAFLSEVQAVCDDLIEDYLHERMQTVEQAAFAQRLHALPFLRERLATERALLLWAGNAPPVLRRQRWALVSAIKSQLTAAWLLPRVATALLALCALGVGIWYAVRNPSPAATAQLAKPSASLTTVGTPLPTLLPADHARPVGSPPAASPAAPHAVAETHGNRVLASLLLSAEMVRSSTELPTLLLPKGKGLVRLQLEVPSQSIGRYRAILRQSQSLPLKTWSHQLHPPPGTF